jgi:hypothetical protein
MLLVFVLEVLLLCAGNLRFKHFVYHSQVGDGTKTSRNTPVSVKGLSSGVAMVALGGVRCGCDFVTVFDAYESCF